MLAAHEVAAAVVRPAAEEARAREHVLGDTPAGRIIEIAQRLQHQRRERALFAEKLAARGRERPDQHRRERGGAGHDEKLEAALLHSPAARPGKQQRQGEREPDREHRQPAPLERAVRRRPPFAH